MTNSTNGTDTELKINGKKLETVTSFKYLGSVITDESSNPEILSRIAHNSSIDITELVWRLDKVSTGYGMEIIAGKTKLMPNNTCGVNTEIKRSLRQSLALGTWTQL